MKRIILSLALGCFSTIFVVAQTLPTLTPLAGSMDLVCERQVAFEANEGDMSVTESTALEQQQAQP